jgi:hypothetical protein
VWCNPAANAVQTRDWYPDFMMMQYRVILFLEEKQGTYECRSLCVLGLLEVVCLIAVFHLITAE